MDPELLRQRRAAEQDPSDAKLLYRYRVAALLAGEKIRRIAGDRVKIGEEEGRVLRVEESPEDPELISVRFLSDERIERVAPADMKVVSPHRPGVLLGEDELRTRLEGELLDAREPRGLETLGEVARRRLKDGIPLAIKLFEQVETAPNDDLGKALTAILRCRPFGEVEVALRHLGTHPMDEDLVELPPMAAAASEADQAQEILDRLEEIDDPKLAVRVVRRAGRGLVGAGGPALASPKSRERLEALVRTHPSKELRVALFSEAATGLLKESDLTAAFASDSTCVRRAAVMELIRRGVTEPVIAHGLKEEEDPILHGILDACPGPLPLELLERLLRLGKKRPALTDRTLIRLAESPDEGALDLLAPWLDKARKTNAAAALWCAGLLGRPEAGSKIVKLLGSGKLSEEAVPLALEALTRLGHDSAAAALDAWGARLLSVGTAGEELADTLGLLLGHPVDARELLGRFVVAGDAGPIRRARALDVALWLRSREQMEAMRGARVFLPTPLPRFAVIAQ